MRARLLRQAAGVHSDCVFCAIITRTAPASVVYEDETAVAFLDIRPLTPGHLLVVPRRHAADLAELDPADGGHLFGVGQRLAAAVRRGGLRCEGVNFFLADGVAAGQEVFHVHLHVLPRFRGDGFRLRATFGNPSRPELDRQAAAVRAALP
ncbi:MAG: histidine triad family protein [Mycobacteriales bacterium]|jgi:diadenosine tetraphosphate (Ap4A) HIT family hydrolase